MFALVDCNNFYVSCERLFRPDLRRRPVVVLSNNDGCVVARSQEAKDLGIKMAVPHFQIRALIERHQVVVFSSNYTLYADISTRVMLVLEEMVPDMEVYSIDEAFLRLPDERAPLEERLEFGHKVRERLRRWLRIPACVGIAPSKTLAKLANSAAKRDVASGGVVDLCDPHQREHLFTQTEVGEVWGVGRRTRDKLHAMGIRSVADLAHASPERIRRRFSVNLQRTVYELNGQPCFGLESSPTNKHQIICSRSFAQRITDFAELREAVCTYTVRAAEKLREQGQVASQVTVFIRTGAYNSNERHYSNSAQRRLDFPGNDTMALVGAATSALQSVWRHGYRYAKAGVMLSDLCPQQEAQPGLFDHTSAQRHNPALMQAVDALNRSGRGKIWFGGQGIKEDWRMKRAHLSPAYTTRWEDIPVVT